MNQREVERFMAIVESWWPGMVAESWSEESVRRVAESVAPFTLMSAEIAVNRLASRGNGKWRPDPGDVVGIVRDMGETAGRPLPASSFPGVTWREASQALLGREVAVWDGMRILGGFEEPGPTQPTLEEGAR